VSSQQASFRLAHVVHVLLWRWRVRLKHSHGARRHPREHCDKRAGVSVNERELRALPDARCASQVGHPGRRADVSVWLRAITCSAIIGCPISRSAICITIRYRRHQPFPLQEVGRYAHQPYVADVAFDRAFGALCNADTHTSCACALVEGAVVQFLPDKPCQFDGSLQHTVSQNLHADLAGVTRHPDDDTFHVNAGQARETFEVCFAREAWQSS
jgi:hypothetical protein